MVNGNKDFAMEKNIKTVLQENRTFIPPQKFQQEANISGIEEYQKKYEESIQDPEKFWENAAQELHWFKKWDKVLDSTDAPFFKWFVNGKTNICYNCLDRHLDTATRDKAAIIWEGEPGEEKVLTYNDLAKAVNQFANGLKSLGLKKEIA